MGSGIQGIGKTEHLFSHLALAIWQFRRSWHLLLMTATGMLTAVVLVCAIPLYSRVALSAGLRTVLTDNPENTYIVLRTPSIQISGATALHKQTQAYNREFQTRLASLLPRPFAPEVIFQTSSYTIQNIHAQVILHGYDIQQAAEHTYVRQGRLPRLDTQHHVVEIALPTTVANQLNVTLGQEFSINILTQADRSSYTLPLRVVGLIESRYTTPDMFWQHSNFQFTGTSSDNSTAPLLFHALVSGDAFLDTLHAYLQDTVPPQNAPGPIFTPSAATIPGSQAWFYNLDCSHLDIEHLDELGNDLEILQTQLPIITSPLESLRGYQRQVQLVSIPTLLLLGLIAGMLLFFIHVTSHLLVENCTDTIALLRSRGASYRQVFALFSVQHIVPGLAVLLCAPLLASPLASLLARLTLSGNDQQALNLLTEHPAQIIGNVLGYAFLMALATVAIGMLAIRRAARLDILSLRRQDAGTSPMPFWQRYYLDIFLVMLAISSYAIALYEGNATTLDSQTQAQVVAPLILATASCMLIACVLLLIRVFPYLLAYLSTLAARLRGALPILALAQLIRTSRQILSSTVLLTLTTAFAVFTLLFLTAQANHAAAIATYTTGADFSGRIDINLYTEQRPVSDKTGNTGQELLDLREPTDVYRHLPGVTAAATGYITTLYTHSSPVTLKAIDPQTFAETAIWTEQNGEQPLTMLMQHLQTYRGSALAHYYVPAIVDAATWDQLKLSPGQRFTLADSSDTGQDYTKITFVAMDRVLRTPMISSSIGDTTNKSTGILVDYTTFTRVYMDELQQSGLGPQLFPRANYFWLRTSDDDTMLSVLRTRLKRMRTSLNTLYNDRRALLDTLYHDPLYLNMLGVLTLGAATPLLLAIIGSLLGSGLSIRRRRHNFAVLRALGTAPHQLIGLLAWEQAPLYLLLLLLGIAGGWLLSSLVLPALVLASLMPHFSAPMTSSLGSDFFLANNLPQIQPTLPTGAIIALAVLVLLCLTALGLVIRVTTSTGKQRLA